MVIRLLSLQIPQFWDIIKYALQQVERFGEGEEDERYNRILAALLNDKSQCFIMYSEDEKVKAVMVTEILEDLITSKRTLNLRCLYAFDVVATSEWTSNFGFLIDVAKAERCYKITYETNNPRVQSLGEGVGFNRKSINMEYKIGD